jgi:hypothetical protein
MQTRAAEPMLLSSKLAERVQSEFGVRAHRRTIERVPGPRPKRSAAPRHESIIPTCSAAARQGAQACVQPIELMSRTTPTALLPVPGRRPWAGAPGIG